MENLFLKEAEVIGRYLIHCKPQEKEIQLYAQAMQKLNFNLSDNEKRIWTFMQDHPWSCSYLDGALALSEPESIVRRKIYTMLAILEASPAYAELFLPRAFSVLYFFKILSTGLRSVVRPVIGLLILRFI